uniref:Uncharacterized protein n=1 Tax=Aegilops tauschii subsp. strangulata TaxID=200361 RepID=A0A452Z3I6_AEGTS
MKRTHRGSIVLNRVKHKQPVGRFICTSVPTSVEHFFPSCF